MKWLLLLATFAAGIGFTINCQADTPTPIAWRAYWIPWHDTYASWDWKEVQGALLAQWANLEKFPTGVRNWEFAACLASDPMKTAREPLQPPLSVEENTWYLERWTPGNFPTDRLATLGNGTFLCAILANGQRISNVSRVTISHAGEATLQSGIRISPLILFTSDIRTLAIRLIPAPDWHIHYFDLDYPYLRFDGVWTRSREVNFEGQNSELLPGKVYGMISGFDTDDFEPSIKSFMQARVQAKFTRRALDSYFKPVPPASNPAKQVKLDAEAIPGYLSEVTILKFSDADIRTFDAAFAQK